MHKTLKGDGVVEGIKGLVATNTGAGSIPAAGSIYFGQITVSGEKCCHPQHRHGRYLRAPTKKFSKPKHKCLKTYSTLPHSKNHSMPKVTAG